MKTINNRAVTLVAFKLKRHWVLETTWIKATRIATALMHNQPGPVQSQYIDNLQDTVREALLAHFNVTVRNVLSVIPSQMLVVTIWL